MEAVCSDTVNDFFIRGNSKETLRVGYFGGDSKEENILGLALKDGSSPKDHVNRREFLSDVMTSIKVRKYYIYLKLRHTIHSKEKQIHPNYGSP